MQHESRKALSRPTFLKSVSGGTIAAAAATSAGLLARSSGAEEALPPARDKIRLGAVSWNFRSISAGPPWTEPIETLAELGFEGIEVICAQPAQLDATLAEPHFSNLMKPDFDDSTWKQGAAGFGGGRVPGGRIRTAARARCCHPCS